MKLVSAITDMRSFSRKCREEGRAIGLVPTMGALHEGHLSLVSKAKAENDITVVSIFVNPTQFGPNEDLSKYPRDTEGDLQKLSPHKVDAVFIPDAGEMYPEGFSTSINIGHIGDILCGASRPGHFNGVATVVAKLLNIVMPGRAYFGQKDLQQTVIVKKLVRDLNLDVDIIVCPTVRETDGLAMSSRNAYLSRDERKTAAVLYRALRLGEEMITLNKAVKPALVLKEIKQLINSETSVNIDYAEIVDLNNLETVEDIQSPVALCVAVKIGTTRLIDNIIAGS